MRFVDLPKGYAAVLLKTFNSLFMRFPESKCVLYIFTAQGWKSFNSLFMRFRVGRDQAQAQGGPFNSLFMRFNGVRLRVCREKTKSFQFSLHEIRTTRGPPLAGASSTFNSLFMRFITAFVSSLIVYSQAFNSLFMRFTSATPP